MFITCLDSLAADDLWLRRVLKNLDQPALDCMARTEGLAPFESGRMRLESPSPPGLTRE